LSDIFDEAEETLRADKWRDMAKKSAPYAIGGLIAVLGLAFGIWGFDSFQKDKTAKASMAYNQGLTALAANDVTKAKAQFTTVAKDANAAYKALSLMQLGGLELQDNKQEAAVKLYDQAAKLSTAPMLSDMASLRAAYIRLDSAPLSEMQTRLAPLAKEGRPFLPLAREVLALAKIKAGDYKGARSDLQNLTITLGTPESLKARAQQYILAIDSGSAVVAREASKADIAPISLPSALTPPQ
jgi:hypothetical protein